MKKDYSLEKRKYVIAGLLILLVVIYLIRLFELQVFDSKYKENADSNAFLRKTIYPSRGQIFDRKGRLVVFNQPAYDVMVIPREIKPDFDSIDFCNTLQIDIEELRRRFDDMRNPRKNPGYSSYTQQVLITHISAKDYGRLQEKLYRFPGFFIQKRILRQYAYENAANLLGNIREVNDNDIKKDDYYRPGDYTGDLGIEKSYEPYLRGFKGQEILIRDANGRIKGRFENGARDIAPISGKDLTLGIDIDLQAYGEKLMQGKTGAIVAIEPATGEILALVSSPTYNPKMLVGRERGKAYRELMNDPAEPLFDRAIMAAYPPGSTFKPTQGLIFRQEGIVSLSTAYLKQRSWNVIMAMWISTRFFTLARSILKRWLLPPHGFANSKAITTKMSMSTKKNTSMNMNTKTTNIITTTMTMRKMKKVITITDITTIITTMRAKLRNMVSVHSCTTVAQRSTWRTSTTSWLPNGQKM